MRILFDTHILVWALTEPERLAPQVLADIEAPNADLAFSAVSIWEIAIKAQVARGDFPLDPEGIYAAAVAAGFVELPVTSVAAIGVRSLPLHHRDPFDRLLVAQAIAAPAYLYTVDRTLAAYSELVRIV
jgi:PIN domain nuclease of toxin-antitoxin system